MSRKKKEKGEKKWEIKEKKKRKWLAEKLNSFVRLQNKINGSTMTHQYFNKIPWENK